MALAWLLACTSGFCAQLADTPWPKYQHDRRNSGCSPYVGPDAPTVRWWSDMVGQPLGAGVVIGTQGELYVPWLPAYPGGRPPAPQQYPGCLKRFERDGSWKWDRGLIEWGGPHATAVVSADDSVLVVDGSAGFHNASRVYSFHPQGQVLWQTEPHYPGLPIVQVAVGLDGAAIVLFEDELVSLDRQGRRRWSRWGNASPYQCPAVGAGGTIYVNMSSRLLALAPQDGSTQWVSEGTTIGGVVLGEDGTVYAVEHEYDQRDTYFLVALNPDGSRQWRLQMDGWPLPQGAIAADWTLYISTWPEDFPGHIWAVNPDGQVKWTRPTKPNIISSIIVDAAGNLYYQDMDGVLTSLSAEGDVRWTFAGGRSLVTTSPALDKDGTLYLPAHHPGDPEGVMRIVALGRGAGAERQQRRERERMRGPMRCEP